MPCAGLSVSACHTSTSSLGTDKNPKKLRQGSKQDLREGCITLVVCEKYTSSVATSTPSTLSAREASVGLSATWHKLSSCWLSVPGPHSSHLSAIHDQHLHRPRASKCEMVGTENEQELQQPDTSLSGQPTLQTLKKWTPGLVFHLQSHWRSGSTHCHVSKLLCQTLSKKGKQWRPPFKGWR